MNYDGGSQYISPEGYYSNEKKERFNMNFADSDFKCGDDHPLSFPISPGFTEDSYKEVLSLRSENKKLKKELMFLRFIVEKQTFAVGPKELSEIDMLNRQMGNKFDIGKKRVTITGSSLPKTAYLIKFYKKEKEI